MLQCVCSNSRSQLTTKCGKNKKPCGLDLRAAIGPLQFSLRLGISGILPYTGILPYKHASRSLAIFSACTVLSHGSIMLPLHQPRVFARLALWQLKDHKLWKASNLYKSHLIVTWHLEDFSSALLLIMIITRHDQRSVACVWWRMGPGKHTTYTQLSGVFITVLIILYWLWTNSFNLLKTLYNILVNQTPIMSICYDRMPGITMATDLPHEIKAKWTLCSWVITWYRIAKLESKWRTGAC